MDLPFLQPVTKPTAASSSSAKPPSRHDEGDATQNDGFEAAYAEETADTNPKASEEAESATEKQAEPEAKPQSASQNEVEADKPSTDFSVADEAIEADELKLPSAKSADADALQASKTTSSSPEIRVAQTNPAEMALQEQMRMQEALPARNPKTMQMEAPSQPEGDIKSGSVLQTEAPRREIVEDLKVSQLAKPDEKVKAAPIQQVALADGKTKPDNSVNAAKAAAESAAQSVDLGNASRRKAASDRLTEPFESAELPTKAEQRNKVTPTTAATPPTPVVLPGQTDQKALAQLEAGSFDLHAVDGQDAELASFKDARATPTSSLASVLSRPETPAMIARQMAEALQRLPDQPVQLSLNPKELGKVKLTISAAEAGITVNVIAERPETLDLMRRNIHELAREFHNIGYASVDFAFSEGQSGSDAEFTSDDSGTAPEPQDQIEEVSETPALVSQLVPVEGLDLRM